MTEDLAWMMIAASVYSIGHHPKNYTDGECPMTAEKAALLADDLMVEYKKRWPTTG